MRTKEQRGQRKSEAAWWLQVATIVQKVRNRMYKIKKIWQREISVRNNEVVCSWMFYYVNLINFHLNTVILPLFDRMCHDFTDVI